MRMVLVYSDEFEVPLLQVFDGENNGADVEAFAEMWPKSIYFEVEVTVV